jgi:hypothetical protein
MIHDDNTTVQMLAQAERMIEQLEQSLGLLAKWHVVDNTLAADFGAPAIVRATWGWSDAKSAWYGGSLTLVNKRLMMDAMAKATHDQKGV